LIIQAIAPCVCIEIIEQITNKGKMMRYKFDYGNGLKKLLCYLIQFMANSGVIIVSLILHFTLTQSIIKGISNDTVAKVLLILFTALLISIALFFICFTFFPRNIVVTDNYIKIRKNAMNFIIGKSWFSSIIPYSSITSCTLYDEELTYGRLKFLRQQVYPCTFFNSDSLVKITDKYGEKYYIPIKNTEEFVEEVNKRIESAKSNL